VILKTVPKGIASTGDTACISSSVEVAVNRLNQPRGRVFAVGTVNRCAKAVKRGQPALWSDFEDRAASVVRKTVAAHPAAAGRPIEVPIRPLHQPPVGVGAVRAVGQATKTIKPRKFAGWGNFEDRTTAGMGGAVDPAIVGSPI